MPIQAKLNRNSCTSETIWPRLNNNSCTHDKMNSNLSIKENDAALAELLRIGICALFRIRCTKKGWIYITKDGFFFLLFLSNESNSIFSPKTLFLYLSKHPFHNAR
jgi:hypothetical protein